MTKQLTVDELVNLLLNSSIESSGRTLMDAIYRNAIKCLERRAKTCLEASKRPNNMKDCSWSDLRYESSWMSEYFKAVYKIEKIKQRLS